MSFEECFFEAGLYYNDLEIMHLEYERELEELSEWEEEQFFDSEIEEKRISEDEYY